MRILIDFGGYDFLNIGDSAMFMVAVSRLSRLWPEATITVVSRNSAMRERLLPNVRATDPAPHSAWAREQVTPFALAKVWSACYRFVLGTEDIVRMRSPRTWAAAFVARNGLKAGPNGQMGYDVLRFIDNFDMVVSAGGGFINDAFQFHARAALLLLGVAQGMGKQTAMFGQGFGPLDNRELWPLAAKVIPRLDMLTLRESLESLRIAKALGAKPDRMEVTGDDAVELALELGPSPPGQGIGFNVRVSNYAHLNHAAAATLSDRVRAASDRLGVPVIPVPISQYEQEDDLAVAIKLLGDKIPFDARAVPEEPMDVVRAADRCRIVVTGSYHAGVFALSRGASVVGLAASPYYVGKFDGLRKQFGDGCHVVRLDQPDPDKQLDAAIEQAWTLAPKCRQSLLDAAEKQARSGRLAYEKFYRIVQQTHQTQADTDVL